MNFPDPRHVTSRQSYSDPQLRAAGTLRRYKKRCRQSQSRHHGMQKGIRFTTQLLSHAGFFEDLGTYG